MWPAGQLITKNIAETNVASKKRIAYLKGLMRNRLTNNSISLASISSRSIFSSPSFFGSSSSSSSICSKNIPFRGCQIIIPNSVEGSEGLMISSCSYYEKGKRWIQFFTVQIFIYRLRVRISTVYHLSLSYLQLVNHSTNFSTGYYRSGSRCYRQYFHMLY